VLNSVKNRVYKFLKQIINGLLSFFSLQIISKRNFLPKISDSRFYFNQLLKDKIDCVLYVGANQGQYFDELRKNFPSAKIFLYEPDPALLKHLSTSLSGDSNYEIRPVAVGEFNEARTFYATSMSGNQKLSSSLLKMTSLHENWSLNSKQVEEFEVEVVKLDNEAIEEFDAILLKIDVQGHELPALRGASELLKNQIVAIDTEVSFQQLYFQETRWLELVEFLEDFQFDLFGIDPWGIYYRHLGELLQADMYFVKNHFLNSNS
jgi:FkbM family methyltransferase